MPLAKGAVNLLGIGTEAWAHHKRKKTLPRSVSPNPDSVLEQQSPLTLHSPQAERRVSNASSIGVEEADEWLQDEVQEHLDDDGSAFAARATPFDVLLSKRLPCPVILPQKRPESKTRGFVRAYALSLADSGIDQVTWFKFLTEFEESVKGEGNFHAVNLSIALGVLTYTVAATAVNPAVHLAAFAVHTSIEAGRRLRNTRQINKYLEHMNDTLFEPHGLYALLMTYKSTSGESSVTIDMKTNIISSITSRDSGLRSKFRTASGKTYGDAQLPECAPLIFPALDAATTEQRQNAFRRASAFLGDYRDRRARAQFQHNNPESALNVLPKEEFSSIFADPNHPINRGGSLNAITGGYLFKGAMALRDKGAGNVIPFKLGRQAGKEGTGVGGASGHAVKRVIGESVLYLMVVNMPTDEEMKSAVELEKIAREISEKADQDYAP
ncbi:hypothetical protein H2200_001352 [Cladophialophora chaetospira]|uniref:Uncharacterized protein n=1 Tax=Cladophialophora chaetospira TaxID=386627 RepID=A0AA39CPI2_9EURO|nr:hypothetical protein H2200_001352 [Cladophialophora chaetospira]